MDIEEMRKKAEENEQAKREAGAYSFENSPAIKRHKADVEEFNKMMSGVSKKLEEQKKAAYEAHMAAVEEEAREQARQRHIKEQGMNEINSPELTKCYKNLLKGL